MYGHSSRKQRALSGTERCSDLLGTNNGHHRMESIRTVAYNCGQIRADIVMVVLCRVT